MKKLINAPDAVLQDVLKKKGGTLLGSTPYPRGSAEFSAHLPKIQAAKPEVLVSMTPGADNIAFLKQVISYGMKKDMRIAQPLLDYWQSTSATEFPNYIRGSWGPKAASELIERDGRRLSTLDLIGTSIALIAGILILVMPRLLNYIVAIYLILIGLLGLFGGHHGGNII